MKMPRMTDDRVQDQALPNVGFNVRGADFGQENIQKMEQGIQGILGEAEKIQIKAQKEADEAVQLEAGTRLASFELQQNQRMREARGENAMGLDQAYKNDYAKLQGEMGALAKNDNQKAMIGRLMLSTDSQLRNNIAAHTSREMDVVYDNKSKAMVEMDRRTAVDSMNPERVAESIGKQKAIVEQMAKKNGWSVEQKELGIREVEEKTQVGYIKAIADQNPDNALMMIDSKPYTEAVSTENIALLKTYANSKKNEQLRAIKVERQVTNYEIRANIVKDPSAVTFDQIDALVGKGTITENDAFNHKKFIVQAKKLENNPEKVSQYLDKIELLPINSVDEVEKIYDMVAIDDSLSDSDKRSVLNSSNIGERSLAGMKEERTPLRVGSSWWTGIKGMLANKKDAVEAFRIFQQSISEGDDYIGLFKKSKKAVATQATKSNKFLSSVSMDWVDGEDDNGNKFLIRKNEEGEFDIDQSDDDDNEDIDGN